MTFEPDAAQQRVLAHQRGPLLLAGPAGTGKTAVLCERFARLVEGGADPERVVLVVGSKRARDEARRAIFDRLRRPLPVLHVLTLHGLAFHVIQTRYGELGYEEPPAVLSATEQFAKVRELLLGEDPADWPAYGSMLELRGFADEVRQFLLRAQEALLTPEQMRERAERAGLSGWRELAAFYRTYLDVLGELRAVDFAGIVAQAAVGAGEGGPLLDHILVDDYQDTTFGAEALLAALAPTSLAVAGDPDSHVFSFQGTTVEPLLGFEERFSGAERVELTTNHRAEGRVTVEAWTAPHTFEEHAAVARELRRIHVEEGVAWGGLAVVVRRQGSHVGGLLRALDDAGIPRSVPESRLPATAEPATFPYVLALTWLARPEERDRLVEILLASDLARLSPASARGLVRAAVSDGWSPSAALGRWDLVDPVEAATIVALRGTLERAEAVAGRSVLEAFRILWADLECSARLVREAENDARARRDLDAIVAFARTVEESGDRPTVAFLESLQAGEAGPGGAVRGDRGPDAVHVLTAHGAAGREFDTVIVVGAVEGNFPSLSRPEPMFDLHTLERRISQSERNKLRLEDERRLFGMVLGRARRRAVLTASEVHGEDEPDTARSRFAEGLSWQAAAAGPFEEPISVREAAAAWRRELADPDAPPTRRLSAIDGLLALAVDPSTWWFQQEWTDTGRPLHETIRTSASKLDKLDNCELQFVLAADLGLEDRAGYAAWVGHTVHRIIEDCERGKIARDVESLVQAARERWRPDAFPSRAVSDSYLRLVTEAMLPAWLEEYGATPALAIEQEFEFEFEGAIVSGFIDRIGGVQGKGSTITDYKTGKKRWGKAAENLQLGVYYLAVNHAEELARFRPVRCIELVFPREKEWRSHEMARIAMGFTPSTEPGYAAQMTERIRTLIARVRELYESERFEPDPAANCRFCTFKPLCPLHPEGRELFEEARQ